MKFTKSGCLKWIIVSSALIIAGMIGLYFYYNVDMPEGKSGPEAERLTQKMFAAINHDAWQEINYVAWDFGGLHQYLWDKERHLARVTWDGNVVLLDPSKVEGVAYQDGEKLAANKGEKLVKKAWGYFINDSFWLNAPALARQPGTTRSVVDTEDGDKQLKVSYTTGGATPGDSYLWKLDETGLPISYQMWVKIIPIGGTQFTWEGWKDVGNGVMLSTTHVGPGFTLEMKDIKTGENYTDFGLETDPFAEIAR